MEESDYPALKNLHKMLKRYIDQMTHDGKYIGEGYALQTYERLDMFLKGNLEKNGDKFSKNGANHER